MSGGDARRTLAPARRIASLEKTLIRRMMEEAPEGCVHLGLGQLVEPVDAPLRAGLAAAAEAPGTYGPNAGIPELRAAIAARHGVDSRQVIVTCGVQQALALAMLGVVNPGDEVLVPDPGFPVYGTLAELAGGQVRRVRMRAEAGYAPEAGPLADALSERTRLVVLASPGNPSGAAATPEAWAEIGALLEARGVPWLSDEIYLPLQYGPRPHGSLAAHARGGMVAAGLSKSAAIAGWRLGWLVVPPELAEPMTALQQQLVTSASVPVQRAALAAFGDEARQALDARCARLRAWRKVALASMARLGWEVCSGDAAFYLLVRPPGVEDELAFARRLMHEAKVILIPGRAFGEGGRGLLRLSFAGGAEALEEATRRIEAWQSGRAAAGETG